MIYLRHRLAGISPARGSRVGVLPLVDDWLRRELCAELAGAFPEARVEVTKPGAAGTYDLLVLPFTHGLHRHFLGEKTVALLRGLGRGARVFLLYDVVHRHADVVSRRELPGWYVRRLGEYLAVRAGRAVRWPRS